MTKEVKFNADGVEVSLTYDAAANTVQVTATHPDPDPNPDDFISINKIDKNGDYNYEPPCHHFDTDGDFSESYNVELLDRLSITVHLLLVSTTNRGVDITENGLRLN